MCDVRTISVCKRTANVRELIPSAPPPPDVYTNAPMGCRLVTFKLVCTAFQGQTVSGIKLSRSYLIGHTRRNVGYPYRELYQSRRLSIQGGLQLKKRYLCTCLWVNFALLLVLYFLMLFSCTPFCRPVDAADWLMLAQRYDRFQHDFRNWLGCQ